MKPSSRSLSRCAVTGLGALGGLLCLPLAAEAHVKWFAPYIVGAPPQPISATLTNPWFWTGIAAGSRLLSGHPCRRSIEDRRGRSGRFGSPDGSALGAARRFRAGGDRRLLRRHLRGRRGVPDAGPQDAGRMGVLDAIADRRPDLLTQNPAAGGSRHHLPVASGAARLRYLSSARLSGARHRRRWISGVGSVGKTRMAQASLRGAALGRCHCPDVVEPGEICLSRLVLPTCRGEAVPHLRHATRRLHPDGGRRRVHDGLRPALDAAGAPALGHRAVRHFQCRSLSRSAAST